MITEDRSADGHGPAAGLAPAFDPGWRGRSMMLAAVGAAVLSRRAFRAAAAGGDRTALEMQILAALALTDSEGGRVRVQDGMTRVAIAWALAAEESAVAVALARLARDGLVAGRDHGGNGTDDEEPEEADWAVTGEGRACVLAWGARIVPLFGAWPDARDGGPDDAC